MAIVTLTTDLGLTDYYVAVLKANLLHAKPIPTIVDISHQIRPFDILHASFTIKASYKEFPENTIHIIGINSEPVINATNGMYPSIMYFEKQYFIATDNGIFELILEGKKPEGLWRIDNVLSNPKAAHFQTKNIFVPTAIKLLEGTKISDFASEETSWNIAHTLTAVVAENVIKGTVIHIDHYGNIITNITKEQFNQFGDIPFSIRFRKREYHIDTISNSYSDVQAGERVAFFNDTNLLEIAINKGVSRNGGGASSLLGLHIDDSIRIEFTPRGSADTIASLF
jgi:hypothetical protein